MAAPVVEWICRELSRLLGVDATEDIAQYILSIENEKDLEEYMLELLDRSVPRNKKFIDQLLKKWKPPPRPVQVPHNVQIYKKQEEDETYIQGQEKQKHKKKSKEKHFDDKSVIVSKQPSTLPNPAESQEARKKQKFVPLFSEEGQAKAAVRLPGRHPCECQAAKHALVSNCLKCGRVVCEQEGSGPCIFCGTLVCSREEQEILARGSKKSEKLRQYLLQQGGGESLPHVAARLQSGLDKAMQHKNRLLEYDRTSVKRTQVIDDESDYFATSSQWLSKQERRELDKREEELRQKRFVSRKDRKITLDFAGRQVLDADEVVDMYNRNDSIVQAVQYGTMTKAGTENGAKFNAEDFSDLVNPHIKTAPPKFVPVGKSQVKSLVPASHRMEVDKKKTIRLQDREIQEMSDEGMCMSMHQPWASLLVHGIKIHEGRTWYSAHRGRLWIAATARKAEPQSIAEEERNYRMMDIHMDFPSDYPQGCLLGCVDVVDCLAQDTYREKYPSGKSTAPFVFICENPQQLVLKFPIKGKHKIYKLDSNIHQAAKKGLRSVQAA